MGRQPLDAEKKDWLKSPFTSDFLVPRQEDAGFVFDLRRNTNPTEQRIVLKRAIHEAGFTEARAYESVLPRVGDAQPDELPLRSSGRTGKR